MRVAYRRTLAVRGFMREPRGPWLYLRGLEIARSIK